MHGHVVIEDDEGLIARFGGEKKHAYLAPDRRTRDFT
jgi:hypothetical protein